MDAKPIPLLLAVLAAGAAPGCYVRPGRMDVNQLTRYQEALAARGPQQRAGEQGLEPLQPVRTVAGPALKTTPIVVTGEVRAALAHRAVTAPDGKPYRDEQGRMTVRLVRVVRTFTRNAKTGALTAEPADELEFELRTVQVKSMDEVHGEYRLDADKLRPQDMEPVELVRRGADGGPPVYSAKATAVLPITLAEAVQRALASNSDIRVVSFDPAVAREQMVQAAAAFDAAIYGGIGTSKQHNRPTNAVYGDETKVRSWNLGVKQHTVCGADWSLEWAMTRTWDNSQFFTTMHTYYQPTLILQVAQPLLRDAGPMVNLAQLRIARINKKVSDQAFRDKVEEILTQVVQAYWALEQARLNYLIQKELLANTVLTYRTVYGRRRGDAALVVIKQAEASVKIREAALIVARRAILDAQDALTRLLDDPQANLTARVEIVPTTPLAEKLVQIDPGEQLLLALRHNPVLAQARLAVAVAGVNIDVARNQTLPRLDLKASAGLQGLTKHADSANEMLLDADYASYSVALSFEYPIGNRERLAVLRQRLFEHSKSIATVQNLADQVAQAVNNQYRQVEFSFQELLAQRDAVSASRDQLTGLKARWEIVDKSPEFTRTLLAAQETLASSRQAELQATVDYNAALAGLARATGTALRMQGVQTDLDSLAEAMRSAATSQPAP